MISRITVFLFVFLFLSGIHTASFSQSRTDPGVEFLREQEKKRELERLKQARPGKKISVTKPKKVRDSICFPVNVIRLRGVSVLDPAKLTPLIEKYKDTCMGVQAIGAFIQNINNVYIEAGYITTRAYVPQQDLNDGELLIDVIEGRIEGFLYRVVDKNGNVKAGKPRKIAGAFPIKPGEVFQLRDIEQGLDQINRLVSSQAKVDLLPGSVQGTTIIVITEQKVDQYRGTIGFDNKGSDVTGTDRVRFSLDIDDIFSLNENYSFSYLGTQNTNVLAYNFSIPYGNWALSSYGSYSESLSPITPLSDIFSQTGSATVKLERLLLRDAEKKIYAYGTLGNYWNSRFINISELLPQNRTTISVGLRQEYYGAINVLSLDTGLTFGVPLFGADQDLDNLTFDVPQAEFSKFDLSLSYLHRFKNAALSSTIVGQWANEPLFSDQHLTIGGWDSVRGYQGVEVSGERGLLIRNELNFSIPQQNLKKTASSNSITHLISTLRPYLFFDAGVVNNLASDEISTMFGGGIGIRAAYKRASIDAVLGVPLRTFNSIQPGNFQGLINVTYKLF